MNRKIKLRNQSVGYTLRKSARARRMRLAVYCNGSFVATMPRGFSESMVEKFIIQKANWVISKLEYFKQFKGRAFKNNHGHYLQNKDEALAFAKERIKYFNANNDFKFNRITVRNQKTRWGSCSKKGNLNFNYKILLLPGRIADYIIVHELCHLKEFNHSKKFWNLVAEIIPDYVGIKKELKTKGLFLQ
ncbi:M48 family metallopeptidase [Candidatus Parcubacteria bacterium]|nr:M48 family metallopeptidase [Patescibacteria group bacterium]MCG2698048.1 M48 family metallopeptidase [Candidatus Parcubacteria bacterium]